MVVILIYDSCWYIVFILLFVYCCVGFSVVLDVWFACLLCCLVVDSMIWNCLTLGYLVITCWLCYCSFYVSVYGLFV